METAKNTSEITLKVPVKKYTQHPTRPNLIAGISVFDMVFIGQKWYSLDEICWIEPNTAYYSHRHIQYPGREIKYSYLVDSVSFSPNGNRLLIVVRSSLVVDGEVKGLYESDCRDPDDIERGDCKVCFILFDMETKEHSMCEADGKRTPYWFCVPQLLYVRWATDEIAYYSNQTILIQDSKPSLIEIGNTQYRDWLIKAKDMYLNTNMANFVLVCSLIRTRYGNWPLPRVYVGHHVFTHITITSTQIHRYMYYVESKVIYCCQIPSSLTEGQKIHSVNVPVRDLYPTCKPIPGKECFISHVTFNGPDAVLHLVNTECQRVSVSLSDQGDKLIIVSDSAI